MMSLQPGLPSAAAEKEISQVAFCLQSPNEGFVFPGVYTISQAFIFTYLVTSACYPLSGEDFFFCCWLGGGNRMPVAAPNQTTYLYQRAGACNYSVSAVLCNIVHRTFLGT